MKNTRTQNAIRYIRNALSENEIKIDTVLSLLQIHAGKQHTRQEKWSRRYGDSAINFDWAGLVKAIKEARMVTRGFMGSSV